MRPYLATIKDAFHEAIASRVLYIMLALITVSLVALAPATYQQEIATELSEQDVFDWFGFVEQLRASSEADKPSPAKLVWSRFSTSLQREILQQAEAPEDEADGFQRRSRLIRDVWLELQSQLKESDFYEERAFKEVSLGWEAKDYLERGVENLGGEELLRFNRLALESAFPSYVQKSPQTAISLRYGGWDLPTGQLPINKKQLDLAMTNVVNELVSNVFGTVGIFVAVLVTAPIIPRMFDTGALHLLLSKPVSRWLLLLTRFVGGCAFILICATYLLTGMFLILGIRFDYWEFGLVWCIPIYVFIFAIYYTVSTLAGLYTRNTVVSIVATVAFWVFCTMLGFAHDELQANWVDQYRLVKLVPADDELIAVDAQHFAKRWTGDDWEEVFLMPTSGPPILEFLRIQEPMIGPVYDNDRQQLLCIQGSFRGPTSIWAADRDEGFVRNEGVASIPTSPIELLREPKGLTLIVAGTGLYRITGDLQQPNENARFMGIELAIGQSKHYQNVGPSDRSLSTIWPAAAAIDVRTGRLAVYGRGKLTLLQRTPNGRYERMAETELEVDVTQHASLAIGGDTLLVAHESGQVLALDVPSLKLRKTLYEADEIEPKAVAAQPGGAAFTILTHGRKLLLYDVATDTVSPARADSQGNISAATFTSDGSLLVAYNVDRVALYPPGERQAAQRWQPPRSIFVNCFLYVIKPLYTVLPKPGELEETSLYMLTGKLTRENSAPEMGRGNLQRERDKIDPWAPVWSGALFIVVVLAVCCFYMERQEY